MRGVYLGLVGCVLLSVGCGATDAGTPGESVAQSGATLLLSDQFEDGGVLQVVEGNEGLLSYSIHAPIRSDLASKRLKESSGKRTLAEVFATLHPGSAVPAKLVELSDRLQKQRPAVQAVAPGILREPHIEVQDKDKSAFLANACVNFYDGNNFWFIPEQCKYNTAVNRVTSNPLVDGDNGNFIDRCYGWNDASWTASMTLTTNSFVDTYPAGTWGWTSWGGVYTGSVARLQLSGSHNGPIGITVHDNVFRPQ